MAGKIRKGVKIKILGCSSKSWICSMVLTTLKFWYSGSHSKKLSIFKNRAAKGL